MMQTTGPALPPPPQPGRSSETAVSTASARGPLISSLLPGGGDHGALDQPEHPVGGERQRRHQDGADDDDTRGRLQPGGGQPGLDDVAEPAAADEVAEGRGPDDEDERGPQPGEDHRRGERHLHPGEHLDRRHPHPPRRLDRVGIDSLEPCQGVPQDRQHRVDDQGDHRGAEGEAGHGEDEGEQGDARHRLAEVGGEQEGDPERPPGSRRGDAEWEGDRGGDEERGDGELDVLRDPGAEEARGEHRGLLRGHVRGVDPEIEDEQAGAHRERGEREAERARTASAAHPGAAARRITSASATPSTRSPSTTAARPSGERSTASRASRRLAAASTRSTAAAPSAGRSSAERSGTSASRRRVRSPPGKPATKSEAGWARSVPGVATWAMRPPVRMSTTRSPSRSASSMSWVTTTMVLRTSDCTRSSSPWSRSRVIGSRALKGSSMSSTGGSAPSARATPTRWRSPPERARGSREAYSAGGSPTSSSSSSTRARVRARSQRSSRGTVATFSATVRWGRRPPCWMT